MAWRTFHDVNPADAPLYVLSEPIDLFNNREDLDILLSRIASLPAGAPTVEFICLDTTSRLLAGADENSSRDLGQAPLARPFRSPHRRMAVASLRTQNSAVENSLSICTATWMNARRTITHNEPSTTTPLTIQKNQLKKTLIGVATRVSLGGNATLILWHVRLGAGCDLGHT